MSAEFSQERIKADAQFLILPTLSEEPGSYEFVRVTSLTRGNKVWVDDENCSDRLVKLPDWLESLVEVSGEAYPEEQVGKLAKELEECL